MMSCEIQVDSNEAMKGEIITESLLESYLDCRSQLEEQLLESEKEKEKNTSSGRQGLVVWGCRQ